MLQSAPLAQLQQLIHICMLLLQSMYKASKERFDDDPDFKERARKAVTMLQGGDADFIKAWERICEASRKVCRLLRPLQSSMLVCGL